MSRERENTEREECWGIGTRGQNAEFTGNSPCRVIQGFSCCAGYNRMDAVIVLTRILSRGGFCSVRIPPVLVLVASTVA